MFVDCQLTSTVEKWAEGFSDSRPRLAFVMAVKSPLDFQLFND